MYVRKDETIRGSHVAVAQQDLAAASGQSIDSVADTVGRTVDSADALT